VEYKYQHFVTAAYLEAWCDPKTPVGYEPYVWIVSKRNRKLNNKSPKNLFGETHFYTIYDSDGNRNVGLEKTLQKIESEFISLRRDIISLRKPLNDDHMIIISKFIATTFARVRLQRDQQEEMWQELLDEFDNFSLEVRNNLRGSGAYEQIVNLRNQPIPYNVINFTNITVPFLSTMNCEIFETKFKPGFITSDNPCFLFDPAIYKPNPPKTWLSLFRSPTVEIIFPISPNQVISLKQTGSDRYLTIDDNPKAIDEINKLTTINSEEFIILNQKEYKDYWFQ